MKPILLLYGFYILVASTMVSSCNSNNKKEVKEYYPSGKLKKSGWSTKNSPLVDTTYYFFENGSKERIEVRNDSGVLNGIVTTFHDNGHISQQIRYINNSVQGFIYSYKDNGQLESKMYHLKSREIGDCYWYDATGNIYQYDFFGFGDQHRNYIKYDANGKIADKIAPFILMDSVSFYTADTSDRKIYETRLLLSNPPKCRTSATITYLSKDSTIIKQDSVASQPYYFKKESFSANIYSIQFTGRQYDSLTGKSQSQTINRPMSD